MLRVHGAGFSGCADLHDAMQSGNLERVKEEIARGASVNQPDQMGATPLHDAAWSGNREIALYLLEHGADVEGAPCGRRIDAGGLRLHQE